MITPAALSDTFSLFQFPAFNPDNPFNDPPAFDPDDPFGEGVEEGGEGQEEPEVSGPTVTVLTKVRLSESSGDRAVDAVGDASARQAILFLFYGVSRADGSLTLPTIKEGDKLVSGEHSVLPEASDSRVWTVKGAKPLKAKNRLHHMEVSLV